MNTRFLALLGILIFGSALEVLAVQEGQVVLHALGQGNSAVITASKDSISHDQPKKKIAVVVDSGNSELKYAASRYDKMGEGSGKTFNLTSTPSSHVIETNKEEDPDAEPLENEDAESLPLNLDEEEDEKKSPSDTDTSALALKERNPSKKIALTAPDGTAEAHAASYEADVLEGEEQVRTALLDPQTQDSFELTSSVPDEFSPSSGNLDRLPTTHRDAIAAAYEKKVIEQMQQALLQVDELVVFVSHPDKDHYNKIPSIFDEEFMGQSKHDRITFVMSGFPTQYTVNAAETWIERMRTKGNVSFLFAGTKDGTGNETADNIQQAYRSSDEAQSSLEKSLVDLTQRIQSTYGLKTDILSMNANVDEDKTTISSAKAKKNTNSMILRFALVDEAAQEIKNSSILIPGDAEGPTWKHALQPYMEPANDDVSDAPTGATADAPPLAIDHDNVKVTHMVLSHHGSSTHDSLTPTILDFFQPQTLFMSNGRNTAFKHPSIEGVKTISDYLERHPSLETEGHYLSYHKMTGAKGLPYRTWTTAPVFATLNSGTIKVNLHETPLTVHVARNRPRSSETPPAAVTTPPATTPPPVASTPPVAISSSSNPDE